MKIKDLKIGCRATLDLVVSAASVRNTTSKPPRPYLAVTLTDGEDTIDGRLWNYNTRKGLPEKGAVYTVEGNVNEYQGKKQITLDDIFLAENQDMSNFSLHYIEAEDIDTVWWTLQNWIETIQCTALHDIVKALYLYNEDAIKQASSAKGVHHVGIGGNMVHTLEVTKLAYVMANALYDLGYPVDVNLCVAGALVHDIGKIYTYEVNGPVVDMTRCGSEQDHIILGIRMLDRCVYQLPEGLYNATAAEALRHIIASHHGELEYGSPTVPLYLEAYIVNKADGLSAIAGTLRQANKKAEAEGNTMTDRIFTLHNRPHILQKDVLGNG